MKKTYIALIFILFLSINIKAQTYPLGHREATYTDVSRSSRSIACHLYYPGTTAGNNVAVAQGIFPVLVFGHGFVMGDPVLYQYLWDSLATRGYICVFPTTESGSLLPPPDHLQFGYDLAFLNSQLKLEGADPSSVFFRKVATTSAIMGHSMGGKASYIACKNNPNVTSIITFGAAIADPPIGTSVDVLNDYASFITIPSLVISGEFDCVAPPADNQVLLYNVLASPCKYLVSIKGGGHCYFASQAGSALLTNCETGESSSCTGNFTINRSEQNARVLEILIPYLDFILKDNCPSWVLFNNRLTQSNKYIDQHSCNIDPFPATAGTITGSSSVCQGRFGNTYTVPVIANADSYIWSYSGTGATLNGASNHASIDFAANATGGNLKVMGINDCGTGAISDTFPIIVNSLPESADSIFGTPGICQGQNGVAYSIPEISNINTYIWNYSGTGAIIHGTTNPIIIDFANNATSGNLTVFGQNTCGEGRVSTEYIININPLPDAAGDIFGNDSVCQGQNNVDFYIPLISNADTYIWSYAGTGATIDGEIDVAFIDFANNATSSDLTVMGHNTCGNGIASPVFPIIVSDCNAGISYIQFDLQINIIPNPNNGKFKININSTSDQSCQIQIINSTGQLIKNQELQLSVGANILLSDISAYSYGLYNIKIVTYKGTVIKRFIIQ